MKFHAGLGGERRIGCTDGHLPLADLVAVVVFTVARDLE